jgi:hypothetical protein
MAWTSSYVYHGTNVSWFALPHLLMGDKNSAGLMGELTAAELRLYIAVSALAGRRQYPVVKVSNDYLARFSGVSFTHIKAAREGLQRRGLVRVAQSGGLWVFEILNPITGASLPSKRSSTRLDATQIEQVFNHYIGDKQLISDANGLRYICPFHPGSMSASKMKHLSVSLAGLWQCTDKECRHHGKRREVTDEDGSTVVTGGGNVLDFVVAILQRRENRLVDQAEASSIITAVTEGEGC